MRIRKILTCVVVSVAAASWAQAAPVAVPGVSGGNIMVNVTSKKEAQFRSTMRQRYDYSCGSAALATLLSSGYEDAVSEGAVFTKMYEAGDKDRIRKQGFSLLDMKVYLESEGYLADGFRISLDKLAELGVPAITILNMKGYHHFVVVKGISGNEVLVSDPAAGTTVYPPPPVRKHVERSPVPDPEPEERGGELLQPEAGLAGPDESADRDGHGGERTGRLYQFPGEAGPMRTTAPKLLIGLALAAVVALWGPSSARADDAVGFAGAEIVPQQELDAARGGYQAGKDLIFSFGVEKATYLNGVLQATTSLNLLQPGGEVVQGSQVPVIPPYPERLGHTEQRERLLCVHVPATGIPGDDPTEQP